MQSMFQSSHSTSYVVWICIVVILIGGYILYRTVGISGLTNGVDHKFVGSGTSTQRITESAAIGDPLPSSGDIGGTIGIQGGEG